MTWRTGSYRLGGIETEAKWGVKIPYAYWFVGPNDDPENVYGKTVTTHSENGQYIFYMYFRGNLASSKIKCLSANASEKLDSVEAHSTGTTQEEADRIAQALYFDAIDELEEGIAEYKLWASGLGAIASIVAWAATATVVILAAELVLVAAILAGILIFIWDPKIEPRASIIRNFPSIYHH